MFFRYQFVDQGLQIYASAKLLEWNEWSAYALKDWKGVVKNKNLPYFRLGGECMFFLYFFVLMAPYFFW